MNNERLILIGAGPFGRELICWIEEAAAAGLQPPLAGYLDRGPDALQGFPYEVPFLGVIEEYQPLPGDRFVMAISDPVKKQRIGQEFRSRGGKFATLVHPSAVVARSARLDEGVVICPNAVVSADAQVGFLVTVNVLSSVGHDVVLGEYSTLSSHVDLTGQVKVGAGCFFGSGARVLPEVSIGDGAKIGAGSVIMRRVAPGTVMYTPPARKL